MSKTYYAEKDDKFLVYNKETGELLRGILSANEDTGDYEQFYVHNPNLRRKGRNQRAQLAVRKLNSPIRIEYFPDGFKKRWHFIIELIKKHNWKVGAEIGLAKGATTYSLVKACPDLTLYVVDYWPKPFRHLGIKWKARRRRFRKKDDNPKRLKLIEKSSILGAENVPDESLDFVFIDADHSFEACLEDIKVWMPKVKPEGMLLGHDVNWNSVKDAVESVFDKFDVWQLDNVWYVWKSPVLHEEGNDEEVS